MPKIINGKKIAAKIERQTAREIRRFKLRPKLAVVFVGSHSPSRIYVKRKQEACARVGMKFVLKKFPADVSKNDLIEKIKQIQKTERPDGLIVQLPLPNPSWTSEVLNAIDPRIDVDCLTQTNAKALKRWNAKALLPPTPGAILEILKELKINLKNKKITIIGQGRLVGKPLTEILRARGMKVDACDSKTKDIGARCRKADVIITAVGKKNLITADMVKRGAVIIDAGTVFVNHKTKGDADFENVKKKAGWITPVPGGVGPVTVVMLLKNTLQCYEAIRLNNPRVFSSALQARSPAPVLF